MIQSVPWWFFPYVQSRFSLVSCGSVPTPSRDSVSWWFCPYVQSCILVVLSLRSIAIQSPGGSVLMFSRDWVSLLVILSLRSVAIQFPGGYIPTFSPDTTMCGWLGSKHQLTNCSYVQSWFSLLLVQSSCVSFSRRSRQFSLVSSVSLVQSRQFSLCRLLKLSVKHSCASPSFRDIYISVCTPWVTVIVCSTQRIENS